MVFCRLIFFEGALKMSYSVNPSSWGAIFPVPASIVDDHIRLAGAIQLKVLLWLLRHISEGIDTDKASEALGISRADTEDALYYWIEAGIIIEDGKTPELSSPSQKIEKEKLPLQKTLPELPYIKPNMEQILTRSAEDPDLQFMFSEAQLKLGKTIGHDGQSTLLMMHDRYGLPIEVILMIVEYCSSVGKNSFSYIAKVGRDWGEREIDTIEKADEQITVLKSGNTLFSKLRELTGISNPKPTSTQLEFLNAWKNELKYDIEIIYLSYEEMANNCSRLSFPYMDKVLRNWKKEGVASPEDIKKLREKRASRRASKGDEQSPASYDIDIFARKMFEDPFARSKKES